MLKNVFLNFPNGFNLERQRLTDPMNPNCIYRGKEMSLYQVDWRVNYFKILDDRVEVFLEEKAPPMYIH